MTERAIDVWLREQKQEADARRYPAPEPVNEVANDPYGGSIHLREMHQTMQQEERARRQFREDLQAELRSQVPEHIKERLQAAQQALQAAQQQQEQAERALQAHSQQAPPVNASSAWVSKFASQKSQLQNELETYQGITSRAQQAYRDALGIYDNHVRQLGQQMLWNARQEIEAVGRKNQQAIEAARVAWEQAVQRAQREEQEAQRKWDRLNSVLG